MFHRHTGVVIDFPDRPSFSSAGLSADAMSVFNPKMLDASIRDVVAALSSNDKTNVLLYAMEHLPMKAESRTVIENGVQSCLQVSSLYQNKVIQARLLRAKARFAAGLRGAAHQDLQAILQLDPSHREATELLPPAGGKMPAGIGNSRMSPPPRFSNEIWRDIASFLPRHDLRNLLLVPHVSCLGTVCLQFGTAQLESGFTEVAADVDKWHAQRSADILTRLVSDVAYAGLVRSLTIWAPEKTKNVLTSVPDRYVPMLATVLPKLINLKVFRCQMSSEALCPLLGILQDSHPDLRGLAIATTTSSPPSFPALRSLNRFVYSGENDGALLAVDGFLHTQTVALHTLVIHHTQIYPAPFLPTSSLRNLFLTLTYSNPEFLSQLFAQGQELECLRLEVNLEQGCMLSTVFRANAKSNSFPALRKLSFVLNTAASGFSDWDLFPAVAEFVRAHPMLDALCMSNTLRLPGFGYDAAIWGMLPSLSNLRTLSIDVPKDLHFALSAWLIPRGVTALELRVYRPATPVVDLTVTGLSSLSLPFAPTEIQTLIHNSLPALRLMRLRDGSFYTVHTTDDRRERFYFDDYLEQLNCEELRFLYPKYSEPWGW
ncbi:hypothetical protein H4582DRAFT_2010040 [Lactarius indigo]|nr:hypothetical protein H4582DRAFT_2010040 [Lactarius indigo]